MTAFLGTFGTETFRRAQGGKFAVSSDSGEPVSKQVGHRSQLASVGIAISQRFKAGPACAIPSSGPFPTVFPSCQTASSPSRCRHQNWTRPREGDLDLPRCSAITPSIGRAFLSKEQDLMRAAQAEQTWVSQPPLSVQPSSRAELPCLGIGAFLTGALGLVIMVCGSCLLATVSCSC